MICEFTEKEKIIPPADPTDKDIILAALGYEEKEVEIDGESMTILVKIEEEPDVAVVGTAIVGIAIAG